MYDFEGYAKSVERLHREAGYTHPTLAPTPCHTLQSRFDTGLSKEERTHAWFLDSVHCALVCKDPIIAFRAFVQATTYRAEGGAHGPAEHDTWRVAQTRIEMFIKHAES